METRNLLRVVVRPRSLFTHPKQRVRFDLTSWSSSGARRCSLFLSYITKAPCLRIRRCDTPGSSYYWSIFHRGIFRSVFVRKSKTEVPHVLEPRPVPHLVFLQHRIPGEIQRVAVQVAPLREDRIPRFVDRIEVPIGISRARGLSKSRAGWLSSYRV